MSLRHKMSRNRNKYITKDTNREAAYFEEIAFDEHLDEQENHHELHHRLRKTLEKLPERQREAICLQYFFKYKVEEIARIMKISRPIVSNTLCNAKKNLRKILLKDKLKDVYFQRKTAC